MANRAPLLPRIADPLSYGAFFGGSPKCQERRLVDDDGRKVNFLLVDSIDGLSSLRAVYDGLIMKIETMP